MKLMYIKPILISALILLFFQVSLQGETGIKGFVFDKITGKPITGVHLKIQNSNYATTTNESGSFFFESLNPGNYKIECSHIAYENLTQNFVVNQINSSELNIMLRPTIYSSDEVVITASRSNDEIKNVPARINIITREEIENLPHLNIDDILKQAAGVNVYSPGGMYSMRPVITLRGLGGDEQGRTLVLLDGVPLNKGDTGGVTWSRINLDDIERIEVFNGPGSSIYGNNAMGGVINIITRRPTKPIEGLARIAYGTYNTLMTNVNVGAYFNNGFYYRISGMYNSSDGYNDLPAEFREEPDYSVARFMNEYNLSTKAGWAIDPLLNIEFRYDHYRNKKGEGEKILSPDGEYRHFDTDFVNLKLNGNKGNFNYSLNVFHQHENYFKLDERIQGGSYSRFDVKSDRIDQGAILNLSNIFTKNNKLVYGIEARFGSVDGGDYYVTSPDSVVNKGKLDTYAFFIHDEQAFLNNKMSLTFGIRYDNARFHDGSYASSDGAWVGYLPPLEDHNWNAISPGIGINFLVDDISRIYVSWSRGFRASILDDLCRSGWMWVGPKIANPELGPETLDNFEIGGDILIDKNFKIAASVFYSLGKDFLYYVATGDSLWGKRPIFQRQNITKVGVFGFEIQSSGNLNEHLRYFADYIFNISEIGQFDKNPELEGKTLKYSPKHQAKAGIVFNPKQFSFTFSAVYKSRQYTSDDNEKFIESYITFDSKISKTVAKKFTIYAKAIDIFDHQHIDSDYYLSPGRRINLGLSFTF